jgi:myosin heavy subunit
VLSAKRFVLLLPSSLTVAQTGERNYHIFYQLLAAGDANEQLQTRMKLQDPELFHFTGQSGVIHIEGVSDEKEFDDVQVTKPSSPSFCLPLHSPHLL